MKTGNKGDPPPGSAKEIVLDNPWLHTKHRMEDIRSAVEMIKQRTKANNLTTAIELAHFAELPDEEWRQVGLLVTIVRCLKDGGVKPPFDIDELYASIALPP